MVGQCKMCERGDCALHKFPFGSDEHRAAMNKLGNTGSDYVSKLEDFMKVVAGKLKCLPSFADPSPSGDNSHIIEKLDELIQKKG